MPVSVPRPACRRQVLERLGRGRKTKTGWGAGEGRRDGEEWDRGRDGILYGKGNERKRQRSHPSLRRGGGGEDPHMRLRISKDDSGTKFGSTCDDLFTSPPPLLA